MKNYFTAIFVYGTLKRGQMNHHLLKNSWFKGKGTVKGHLIDIGYFPGLIGQKNEGDERTVKGELYYVDKEILKNLDVLEGEGMMYKRIRTIADMGNQRAVCFAYYWLKSTDYPIIQSGQW